MKILIFLMALMGFTFALANEVKIEINPTKPVAGEVFQAYFRVFTDADETPVINFTPGSLEVVSKSNQGISTRTVYANGKLSVTREMTVVYDLVASKTGTSFIRDITVTVGAKVVRHPTIAVTVIKEPEVMPEVFVMADVPKKSLFLGEGIIVRYYLYSKVPVNNLDIKKYPKLDHFLKRFLQEAERSERVSVDGQIYMRNQIYSAKLFPEKLGDLKVDALHLSATYPQIRPGDPFGNFGVSRDYRTKTMSSDVVKINVKPLPAPAPDHFTGLIGKHDFQLEFRKSKLIVNEPLEVKLTVSGGGALESLEAPSFIKHQGLEEFESNGDLKIADPNQATKVFEYTFLAKENLKIPEGNLTLSYFDPDSEKYVPVQMSIPEIVVAGGNAVSPGPPKSVEPQLKKEGLKSLSNPRPTDLSEPILNASRDIKSHLPWVNFSLAGLAAVLALSWLIKSKGVLSMPTSASIPKHFKQGQFSLSEFTKWMEPLIKKTGRSPLTIIKSSNLDQETKSYFIDLLASNDYKDYSAQKAQLDFKYQSRFFKNMDRYIESAKNEDSSQPS